jgi:hypothetical protein
MAYLPTVEFGPGMTSATQIRSAWPGLDERRKTALVMSLYPRTQTSPQLAQTVVKLLDAAIGGQEVAEGSLSEFAVDGFGGSGDNRSKLLASVGRLFDAGNKVDWQVPGQMGHVTRVQDDGITMKKWKKPHSRMSFFLPMTDDSRDSKYTIKMVGPKHYAVVSAEQGVAEASKRKQVPKELDRDPQLRQAMLYAKQHYPQHANDPEMAMMKWLQRGLNHSEREDQQHDRRIAQLTTKVASITAAINQLKQQQVTVENNDYLDE